MATLRELRIARGLTQGELAKRASVSVATINRLEMPGSVGYARFSTQKRICMVLEVDRSSVDEFSQESRETGQAVIYGLVDPRDQNIKYVGQTIHAPERRLAQHLYESRSAARASHLYLWIRELVDEQYLPEPIVLEVTTSAEAPSREKWWIAHLHDQGAALTNTSLFQPPANPPHIWPSVREVASPDDLIEFRRQHKLSQTQLADLLGYDKSAVSRWESGSRLPPPGSKLLLALAESQM